MLAMSSFNFSMRLTHGVSKSAYQGTDAAPEARRPARKSKLTPIPQLLISAN